VLFGLLLPWRKHRPIPSWPYGLAVALWLPACAAPSLLRPIHRTWMRLGHLLGAVNSRVLLTLVFILVLTPVGVIRRLLRRRRARGRDAEPASYRIPSAAPPRSRMEAPF
jgi:hypothetical protein